MRVTIKEVAIEAGVSQSTVSRVLHNSPKITEQTKEKVNKAIDKLGYHPNALASSLAGKPTKTIGLVLPNNSDELFKNTFFVNAMRGISIYAQRKGYFLMYSFSKNEDEEIEFIEKYMKSGWVSGVILLNTYEHDRISEFLKSKKFPFVIIGSPENSEGLSWVDNDNCRAMQEVVQTLVDKGKRRIGFIGGPRDLRVTGDRYMGYLSVLEENCLEPDNRNEFFHDSFTEDNGYISAMQMMKDESVDAIVTTDDLFSIGVINALRDENRRDIMVTGFNNSPRAEYMQPSLSTVDINADLLGEKASEILISMLEDEDFVPKGVLVNSKFIERESTELYNF